jgi:PAS domain S-box-containing protein
MASNEIEARYRLLFEESPICQWEEDFSEVKKYVNSSFGTKISNLSEYLEKNPIEVKKIAQMVKIVNVNNKTLQTYAAKDKEELIGNLDVVFGEESYPMFKDEILALCKGEKAFESEAINYKLTGEKIYVLMKLAVIPGYEETLSRVIVSIIDITDQKITEEALRQSERKYKQLFSSIPVGIGLATFDGTMLDYNDAMIQIMRYTPEMVKTINARKFYVNPQDRTDIMLELKKTRRVRNKEVAVKRGDGTVFPCLINMDSFKLGNDDVVFSAFIDNTEIYNYRIHLEELVEKRTKNLNVTNKELQKTIDELKKKSNELEEFVYTLSHDLRTPLLSIDGFAYLIHEMLKEHLNEEIINYFERIKRNTDQMNRTIEDILEYSRIGRVSENREDCSLSVIIDDVIKDFLPLISSKNIQISVEKFMPIVHIERKRFIQVFENLIGNAIKYMGKDVKKKKIEIGINDKSDKFVTVFVRDTGTGIKEKYIPKLFQLFTRIPNSISEEVSGSGIGLANVKKIVEHHGGTVWVESEEKIGTIFYFEIPLGPVVESAI